MAKRSKMIAKIDEMKTISLIAELLDTYTIGEQIRILKTVISLLETEDKLILSSIKSEG